jgi:uncharacterized protein YegJ (DUF2314 family)
MRSFTTFLAICAMLSAQLPAAAQADAKDFEQREDIIAVENTDPEMTAAIAKARATLSKFLEVLRAPPSDFSGFGFKFPLGGNEHIWVANIRQDGAFLVGTLANEPAQDGHAIGDTVRVPLSNISDWVYFDQEGRAQGHFTTQVLLTRMDVATAKQVRAALGWD